MSLLHSLQYSSVHSSSNDTHIHISSTISVPHHVLFWVLSCFPTQVSCILIPTRHELGESSTLWWSTDEIKGMRSRYVCEERLKRSISTGSSNNSTSTHNAPLKARNSRTVSAPCWNPFNPHHSQ